MDLSPAPKRRKIRKGTQSCWQCKRRKTRCTFAAPGNPVCDGCRSRQVKCISQDLHDEVGMAGTPVDTSDAPENLTTFTGADLSSRSLHDRQKSRIGALCSSSSNKQTALRSTKSTGHTSQITPDPSAVTKCKYDELRKGLLSVWPSQEELEIVMSVDVGVSVLFHGTVCMPYSKFLSRGLPSQQETLRLPSSDSHPVLIARKLLLLGLFLQGISPAHVEKLCRLGVECHETMSHAVDTVSSLITSNDDLINSLEGIECIMIESMYQNNAGNLRRAWLTNRRAMTIAQMMGLHTGVYPRLKMLDVETRERIDPDHMWLRLVISDRYLSLMLGFPQGSQDNPFATSEALRGCEPIERMERLEAAAGGLILQRNQKDLRNFEMTSGIDILLQDAAASMPADWWLIPTAKAVVSNDSDALRECIRITNQFAHYHTLAQLHLPYLLCSSADRSYDYSKITAVNASREILLRYMWFHGSDKVTAYCRGIDFLAFTASTILCLAHIDRCRQCQSSQSTSTNVLQFLIHQRSSDRGLMERTLRIMEDMVRTEKDAVANKISNILRRLLVIESAAIEGSCYSSAISSQTNEQTFSCDDDENSKHSDEVLNINIPHFGTIRIEPSSGIQYVKATRRLGNRNKSNGAILSNSASVPESFAELNSSPNPSADQVDREGLSSTTLLHQNESNDQRSHGDFQSTFTEATSIPTPRESQSGASHKDTSGPNHNPASAEDLTVSGLTADEDDWVLQGVDMNLFDNLFEWQSMADYH